MSYHDDAFWMYAEDLAPHEREQAAATTMLNAHAALRAGKVTADDVRETNRAIREVVGAEAMERVKLAVARATTN